ncbi:PKI domain containing protein [Asbolus verrucosus]|uniref:PKI domain containing protein n=1 Tax=Asbolus verrucosus TaxID=1661398 RepID=A0A482VAM5_ASBVE|nr:PKI domain containing protein [Asbolus verrucosus]
MLAVMEASQTTTSSPNGTTPPTPDTEESRPQDFLQSGRTGRRNALANILGEHAIVTSSDLPSQLEALTTKDKDNNQSSEASTSKS